MSNRWCIIAGPRSGSTWLEVLLKEHLKFIKNDPIMLGEFFHLDLAKIEHFVLLNNYIFSDNKSKDLQYPTDQEIYENIITSILLYWSFILNSLIILSFTNA